MSDMATACFALAIIVNLAASLFLACEVKRLSYEAIVFKDNARKLDDVTLRLEAIERLEVVSVDGYVTEIRKHVR